MKDILKNESEKDRSIGYGDDRSGLEAVEFINSRKN